MKILQVMPDFELAGAQTMCENLVMELIRDKSNIVEIVSFFAIHSEITERLEKKHIKIHYLNKKKGLDITIFFKLRNILNQFQPDIIHTHRYALQYVIPALQICKNKKVKIIHTVHNVADKEVPKKLQRLQKIWFQKKKAIPVAISEVVQESIIKRYELNKENVPMIYNGIQLSKCIQKENYEFSNCILHIGRFCEQKNHVELIDIFSKCLEKNEQLKLYLVGTGELKSFIEEKVKHMKLEKNVVFVGAKPDCYEIMHKADIFVMPSKWEGMPMTIIEAMGTGLPIVANNVGGISNMIEDNENGYLISNNEQFVNTINLLCNDIELRKKIGQKAIESSKKYASSIMFKKYMELYNE